MAHINHPSENRSLSDLQITYLPTSSLTPRSRNPRTHSKRQVEQIASSIKGFGFTNPLLIDAEHKLLAGHGRLAAAKLLGLNQVPTIRLDHMTEEQKRAYVIADNRLAEKAGWDQDLLKIELQELSILDLSFDLTITGFETPELDLLILDKDDQDKTDPADEVKAPDPSAISVTQRDDLWLLGKHRLLCGDALDPASYARLMDQEKAQMIFTDPPYNVPISGHVCGLGQVQHREFAMASGEMTEAEFTEFLKTVFSNVTKVSSDGSIHFICMDWRHMGEVLTASKGTYAELKNLCVWNKTNGGMGSLYRSKHELVFVFKYGAASHINNVELGKHGRYRTNVWDYAGVNTLKADRMEELSLHPTVKPVQLVADAILDCSKRGGIVLDPFMGSGTTLIAAEKTQRKAYGLEIDPLYVDTIIQRWEKLTGQQAIHAETKLSFNELKGTRESKGGANV